MEKLIKALMTASLLLQMAGLNAEYIVFKQGEDQVQPILDADQYTKIYDTFAAYQWPMVLGTELNGAESKELNKNTSAAEEQFFTSKIKSTQPYLQSCFCAYNSL